MEWRKIRYIDRAKGEVTQACLTDIQDACPVIIGGEFTVLFPGFATSDGVQNYLRSEAKRLKESGYEFAAYTHYTHIDKVPIEKDGTC